MLLQDILVQQQGCQLGSEYFRNFDSIFFQILLHDHNEFINEKIFLKGIDIFCDVITEIASV